MAKCNQLTPQFRRDMKTYLFAGHSKR